MIHSSVLKLIAASVVASAALQAHSVNPPACKRVVAACQKGGYIIGKKNKHPGVGLWSGCVRPLSKGKAVPGVTGVSKRDAAVCLQARKVSRTPRG